MDHRALLLAALAAIVWACDSSPGRPAADSAVIPPSKIVDFNVLYASNCAGCHGVDGTRGLALSLADPLYLAIVDDATIRRVITEGVPGAAMPAFAQSAGGLLTAEQVDTIVKGIRTRWAKPTMFTDVELPAYAAQAPGDAKRGENAYTRFCASCHGPAGRGGPRGSSIVDGAYLTLVSNQSLRTTVIVGRPDMGAPDWRSNVPGTPMSSEDISDVVAWLAAQRRRLSPPGPSDRNAKDSPPYQPFAAVFAEGGFQ
jgi:mono/diheme cytochrome c family protein